MMKKDESIKYAHLNREMAELGYKFEIIKAIITKDIWTNPIFDKEILRKAELTLRLDDDAEYQSLLNKMADLIEKRTILVESGSDFNL